MARTRRAGGHVHSHLVSGYTYVITAPFVANVWWCVSLLQLQWSYLVKADATEEFDRRDASSRAATRRLILAGMAHISMVLQHQPDQQQVHSEQLLSLAQNVAMNALKQLEWDVLWAEAGNSPFQSCDVGPHTVASADITLLLVTYACTLKQHGHLPALSTQGGSTSSGRSGNSSGRGSGRGSGSSSRGSGSRSGSRNSSRRSPAAAGGTANSSSSNQQRRRLGDSESLVL